MPKLIYKEDDEKHVFAKFYHTFFVMEIVLNMQGLDVLQFLSGMVINLQLEIQGISKDLESLTGILTNSSN
jgi:hypothetical protein